MKEIQLTRGFVALVDDEDYERINSKKWCLYRHQSGNNYAMRKRLKGEMPGSAIIYMHREILGTENISNQTHHLNKNGLDNRKANLLMCNGNHGEIHSRERVALRKSIYSLYESRVDVFDIFF